MFIKAVLEQVPLAPITEYVVLVVGVGAMVDDVAPVFHVYVVAPPAVKFADCPLQIVLVPVIETVKVLATVTVAIAALLELHPAADVPFTEYDVVLVGETTAEPLE